MAGPSVTAWTGPVRSKAWAASTVFHAGLSSTEAAPALLIPWTATTNSGRFDVMRATRSPGTDAPVDQVPGEPTAEVVEVPERPDLLLGPHRRAVAEPCRRLLQGVVHQGRGHWKHSSRS